MILGRVIWWVPGGCHLSQTKIVRLQTLLCRDKCKSQILHNTNHWPSPKKRLKSLSIMIWSDGARWRTIPAHQQSLSSQWPTFSCKTREFQTIEAILVRKSTLQTIYFRLLRTKIEISKNRITFCSQRYANLPKMKKDWNRLLSGMNL